MSKLIYFIGFVLIVIKLLATYGVVSISSNISWWLIIAVFALPTLFYVAISIGLLAWIVRKRR